MARKDQDGDACPGCNGTGEVLLLFSWTKCPACGGTGVVDDDAGDTGKHPVVTDEEDGTDARCDDGLDDIDFDDGLDLDEKDEYVDLWEPDDS